MPEKTQKKGEPAEEFNVFQSELVPKHELLTEDEKRNLLARFNVEEGQLPKIKSNDPAARALNAKKGDILRIIRKSPTAGESLYFRLVI